MTDSSGVSSSVFTHRLTNHLPVKADCFGVRFPIATRNFEANVTIPAPFKNSSHFGIFDWELYRNKLSRELKIAHQPNFDANGPTGLAVELVGVEIVFSRPEPFANTDRFFAEIDLYFDTLGEYLLFEHGIVRDPTLDTVRRSTTFSRTRPLSLNEVGEIIEPPGSVTVDCSLHQSHRMRGSYLTLKQLEGAFSHVSAGYEPLAWRASLGEARRNFLAGQFRQAVALAGIAFEIFLSEPDLAKIDSRLDRKSRFGCLLDKQMKLGLISEQEKKLILDLRNDATHANRLIGAAEAEEYIFLVTRLTALQRTAQATE